ncbi:transporter [Acinetobacter sp. MB5]|uniref:transporter n=1 Tax=Acinetobacter sp. MB5 TaxID=2069438 RepID=UPI000DD091F5|nr:transporter [Acinetobacter sp. MB5]
MKLWQITAFALASTVSMHSLATDFSFDRPGSGFGTSITPVGQLAWEQSLPSVSYTKQGTAEGYEKTTTIQTDMLFRTGLTDSMELRLGWEGPAWTQIRYAGQKFNDHGLGDVSVGVKKAIDLQDDKMTMAVLGQVSLATGNQGFREDQDTYTIGSTVAYQQNDLLNTSITMYYAMQDGDWSWTAIPTLNYKIVGKWSGYSEFVYRKQESKHEQTSLATGLVYNLNNRTQFDASVGVGLSGDVPDYSGGFGVSYLF